MFTLNRRRFSLAAVTTTLAAVVPFAASAKVGGSSTKAGALTAEDRLEIHDLYARYAWALGTGDTESFVACFTSDAVYTEDIFEEADRRVGAAAIRAAIESFRNGHGFPGHQHHAGHIVIEGNNARANAKAFCFVTHCSGEPPYPIRMTGYYTDVVVKQDGRWLFKERLVRDWSGPILKGFPGQSGKKVPRKRPTDVDSPAPSGQKS